MGTIINDEKRLAYYSAVSEHKVPKRFRIYVNQKLVYYRLYSEPVENIPADAFYN